MSLHFAHLLCLGSVKKITMTYWSNLHSLYTLKEKLMHSKEGDRITWKSKGCCNHSLSYLPKSLYGLEATEGFFFFSLKWVLT